MQEQARTVTRGAVWAAVVGSFLASGALVAGATRAALDAPPQAASASVRLPADGVVRTRLDVPAMIPGDSVVGCVEVDHPDRVGRGTDVRVHGSSTGGLVHDLRLTIRHGSSGSRCASPGELTTVFEGALDDLGADFDAGSAGFAPSLTPATIAYPYTLRLDRSTSNSQQGATASVELRWEVRPASSTR